MSDYKLVAAIDFGTTYSSFAFGMVDDLKHDPMKIIANEVRRFAQKNLLSPRTPMCLLLDRNQQFISFGYEAENQYYNMIYEEKENFYFFYRFKMNLNKNKESFETMELKEAGGKALPAIAVFTMSIKALKDNFLRMLVRRGIPLQVREVLWVLTVPAIWTDSAKLLMRKAALKAGIDNDRLKLVLEPEAASLYCQHIHVDRSTEQRGFGVSAVGTRYMVIDLGETADITVLEKLDEGLLKEVYKASSEACGGTALNSNVLGVLEEIIGNKAFSELKRNYAEEYKDLLGEIEVFKRNINPESDRAINITIPYVSLHEICMKMCNTHINDLFEKSLLRNHISLIMDSLCFSADFARQLFRPITDQIVKFMSVILQHPEVESVNRFLLVGGFSESPMVQHAIWTHFPEKQLVFPQDADLAVVKGAVLFGHRTRRLSIKSRIIKYSDRVKTIPIFDPMAHDRPKKAMYY